MVETTPLATRASLTATSVTSLSSCLLLTPFHWEFHRNCFSKQWGCLVSSIVIHEWVIHFPRMRILRKHVPASNYILLKNVKLTSFFCWSAIRRTFQNLVLSLIFSWIFQQTFCSVLHINIFRRKSWIIKLIEHLFNLFRCWISLYVVHVIHGFIFNVDYFAIRHLFTYL